MHTPASIQIFIRLHLLWKRIDNLRQAYRHKRILEFGTRPQFQAVEMLMGCTGLAECLGLAPPCRVVLKYFAVEMKSKQNEANERAVRRGFLYHE